MPDRFYESAELLGLELGDVPYLVPGILAREDKIVCVAKEKTGKSLLAQQLASCVAGGHAFLGHAPAAGDHRVLYVSGEGSPWTWQSRARRMGYCLPVPEDRLWYWQTSMARLNTPRGLSNLTEKAAIVRPDLTIIDPIYTSIAGSMKDDETAIAYVQNINAYQEATQSAVLLTHHAHRPVQDADRQIVDQGDQAYFGAFVWAAWPESLWLMRRDGASNQSVTLSCTTAREGKHPLEKLPMMMAEPSPLAFVPRMAGIGPTGTAVLMALRWQVMTAEGLAVTTQRQRSTISEALTGLRNIGLVVGDGRRPETFEVVA
tara:strand:- start:370 stop:1320 length:951 start_codon:yes stop_codon:yes gene_type:complete